MDVKGRLHRAARNAGLADAIAWAWSALGAGAVGLAYSPARCYVLRCKAADAIECGPGRLLEAHSLAEIFEARLFSAAAELRWLHHARGAGRAVLLREQDEHGAKGDDPSLDFIATCARHYLLWGRASVASASGWVTLATARTGAIEVPVDRVGAGGMVALSAVEYLAAGRFGNAWVAEERLTGLAPCVQPARESGKA